RGDVAVALKPEHGDVPVKVGEAGCVILVIIGDNQSLEPSDAAPEQRSSRLPSRRSVVAAIDQDVLTAAGRNERTRTVLDVKNIKYQFQPPMLPASARRPFTPPPYAYSQADSLSDSLRFGKPPAAIPSCQ